MRTGRRLQSPTATLKEKENLTMKKTKIIVTFDSHNLPVLKAKNVSKAQLVSASMFLNGISRTHRVVRHKKSANSISGFIRRLRTVAKTGRHCKEV